VPRAEYAPAVVESGKRLEAKSNADDTEYDRLWRGAAAGLFAERGSSSESETLREEDSPEGEDDCDLREVVGVEEAREASSSESLGGRLEGVLMCAYPARDMTVPSPLINPRT
jgi:hypothetical protein